MPHLLQAYLKSGNQWHQKQNTKHDEESPWEPFLHHCPSVTESCQWLHRTWWWRRARLINVTTVHSQLELLKSWTTIVWGQQTASYSTDHHLLLVWFSGESAQRNAKGTKETSTLVQVMASWTWCLQTTSHNLNQSCEPKLTKNHIAMMWSGSFSGHRESSQTDIWTS